MNKEGEKEGEKEREEGCVRGRRRRRSSGVVAQ